jgi:hypothetical protein
MSSAVEDMIKKEGPGGPLKGKSGLLTVAVVVLVRVRRKYDEASVDRGVDRICFPGRREAIHGGFGQIFLICTPRKTNVDPFVVRTT